MSGHPGHTRSSCRTRHPDPDGFGANFACASHPFQILTHVRRMISSVTTASRPGVEPAGAGTVVREGGELSPEGRYKIWIGHGYLFYLLVEPVQILIVKCPIIGSRAPKSWKCKRALWERTTENNIVQPVSLHTKHEVRKKKRVRFSRYSTTTIAS